MLAIIHDGLGLNLKPEVVVIAVLRHEAAEFVWI